MVKETRASDWDLRRPESRRKQNRYLPLGWQQIDVTWLRPPRSSPQPAQTRWCGEGVPSAPTVKEQTPVAQLPKSSCDAALGGRG